MSSIEMCYRYHTIDPRLGNQFDRTTVIVDASLANVPGQHLTI